MKKSLIALAALTAFAGAASAQSSVTLFGVLDAGVGSVKTGSTSVKKQGTNGNNPSRFGLRGTEDLGNGLSANFWLEAGIAPDTGASATTGKLFDRRATVGLAGAFGEVRLGRDTLAVWNNEVQFDPFGSTGVGQISNLVGVLGTTVTTNATAVTTDNKRADNQVAYYLPGNLGGVYGQLQYSFREGGTNTGGTNGARLGYKGFGFDGAVAVNNIDVDGGDYRIVDAGASYDFNVVKLTGQYIQIKLKPTAGGQTKQKLWQLGAVVPVSAAGALKATYAKVSDAAQARQLAVGYQHDLSKRTALYATYAQIKNKDANAAFVVNGAPAATAGLLQKSSGYEFGIRHNF
jgi:predicted porin